MVFVADVYFVWAASVLLVAMIRCLDCFDA